MVLIATPLIGGAARGPVMRLQRPLSFWGGVDPRTGTITDPASDGHGRCLAGHVVALAATRGSSSSSSVLLELIVAGKAPAALLLAETDAILAVGSLVARELGRPVVPILRLSAADQSRMTPDREVVVSADGIIAPV